MQGNSEQLRLNTGVTFSSASAHTMHCPDLERNKHVPSQRTKPKSFFNQNTKEHC